MNNNFEKWTIYFWIIKKRKKIPFLVPPLIHIELNYMQRVRDHLNKNEINKTLEMCDHILDVIFLAIWYI